MPTTVLPRRNMTKATHTSMNDLPLRQVVQVSVELLALDRTNPRLVNGVQDMADEEIVRRFHRAEDLAELLQSIAANGYLNIEPMVVVQENNQLVVLEGNRRLAAIRLFREPSLARSVFETQERAETNIPEMPEGLRDTLDEVSVYRVDTREDARAYIGFKHINGTAKWDSYAKAKFAAQWHQQGGVEIDEIADRIGDKHSTVKRMINAIYVLEQARSQQIFDLANRTVPRFNFSHLYTALARGEYRQFLGQPINWANYRPQPNPVPEEKLSNLGEVLVWLYGAKDEDMVPMVQRQNPDIKHLGEVLENEEGLAVLRAGGSLASAYASIQPADQEFSASLLRARHEIQTALARLRGFDGRQESLMGVVGDIQEAVQTLLERMEKKIQHAADSGDKS